MKKINNYILEKLNKINSKNFNSISYKYFPEDIFQLQRIISRLIKERGKEADLNDIDTSKITDMTGLFSNTNFNGDISKWDVSNVENMSYMFEKSKFNGDISYWDVSHVKDMYAMFDSSNFNGDISNWDVSNVQNMIHMFKNTPLEKNPPKWYKK